MQDGAILFLDTSVMRDIHDYHTTPDGTLQFTDEKLSTCKFLPFCCMVTACHYHSVNEHNVNEWLVQLFNQKLHAITFANNITKTTCLVSNNWIVAFWGPHQNVSFNYFE